MDWEILAQEWFAAANSEDEKRCRQAEMKARKLLRNRQYNELQWHLEALAEQTEEHFYRRHFIRIALRDVNQMPDALFAPMLWAAVYAEDPSFNRLYIYPCLRCFGRRKVNEELLRYAEQGSNSEKCGAANAFYWSLVSDLKGMPHEDIQDLVLQIRIWQLTEFVTNIDVNVRRNIVPHLKMDVNKYPSELRALLPEAIRIAREHSDDYIRHRIEIQLGSGGPSQALPARPTE